MLYVYLYISIYLYLYLYIYMYIYIYIYVGGQENMYHQNNGYSYPNIEANIFDATFFKKAAWGEQKTILGYSHHLNGIREIYI